MQPPTVVIIKSQKRDYFNKEQVLGTGYELEREQETTINGLTQTWTERVLLIRSDSYLKNLN